MAFNLKRVPKGEPEQVKETPVFIEINLPEEDYGTPLAKVVNIKSREPFDIFIGRPNNLDKSLNLHIPFPLIEGESREERVQKMKIILNDNPELTENLKKLNFGNPFIIGRDGSREEVIEKAEIYILANDYLMQKVKKELKGKSLGCFCSPLSCHGDVWLKYANPELTEQPLRKIKP